MFIRNCISKYIGVVYFLFNDIFQEKKNPYTLQSERSEENTLHLGKDQPGFVDDYSNYTEWVVYEEEVYRSDNLCYFILPMDYMLVGGSWGDSG